MGTSIKIETNSPFIFGNKKTDFSVDFGTTAKGRRVPCPLMKWMKPKDIPGGSKAKDQEKEQLTSPFCKGCYAATNLNVRTQFRDKIINLPEQSPEQLEAFKADLPLIKALGVKRLRFYSWTDFTGAADLDYIFAAADAGLEVHILSKILATRPCQESLLQLFDRENVIVSLSFNKDWTNNLNRIINLLGELKPGNVQINYTINPEKEKETDLDWLKKTFQVIHLTNKGKRKIAEKHNLPETQLCGVFDSKGNRVAAGGACRSCNNCNHSFVDHQKGLVAKLPAIIAA